MTAPTVETAAGSVVLAESARGVQLRIRAQLLLDVTRLWPLLDGNRLNETFPGWLRAMSLLVTNYHGQSAAAASRFYRAARAEALQSPTPSALVKLAPVPPADWLDRAFGFSGPGMLSQDTTRPNTALTTTLGTASRVALDGARSTVVDTVHTDPAAVGWYRVTDGAPCAFCALLSARPVMKGRGSLYRSKDTASFQAHDHCACQAAPFFHIDQALPEANQKAAAVYLNRGKGPALPAFRKAWADHQGAQSA